jgi:pyruvate/2-oxoglutarate/acetoin dehydrogenase E1 component
LITLVNEAAFDWLDAPMVRVAAADVPVPRAEVLEDLAIPNTQAIVRGCLQALGKGSS